MQQLGCDRVKTFVQWGKRSRPKTLDLIIMTVTIISFSPNFVVIKLVSSFLGSTP